MAHIWLDHDLAGVHSSTDRHLVQTTPMPLEDWQRAVDPGVGDLALIDSEEAVCAPANEAYVSTRFSRETDVVAVSPWVLRADGRRDGRVVEAADAAKLLADDLAL